MGLKCHLDTGKHNFLMSLYFDKNAQTPQNDTVNSWRVNEISNFSCKYRQFLFFTEQLSSFKLICLNTVLVNYYSFIL